MYSVNSHAPAAKNTVRLFVQVYLEHHISMFWGHPRRLKICYASHWDFCIAIMSVWKLEAKRTL